MFRRSRLCGQHPSHFCNLTSIPPGQKQHYHQNVRRINQIAPPQKKKHTHTQTFLSLCQMSFCQSKAKEQTSELQNEK